MSDITPEERPLSQEEISQRAAPQRENLYRPTVEPEVVEDEGE